jgi:hypothetical protein
MKSLIKLLFGLITPIVVIIVSAMYLYNANQPNNLIVLGFIFGSLVNSLFYFVILDKVKLFPYINYEWIPMIGVGAGIENNGINQSSKLIIFIPFVTFTFYDKYKKDRKPTNTKI